MIGRRCDAGLLGLLVLLACRADVLYDEGACDARARDGGAWDEWAVWGLLEATAVAVDWTQRGRERWLQQEGAAVAAASDAALDVPAYVMNLARRQDRRQHSAALLRALGVRRVVFPETIPAAELDVQAVLAQGWLTPESLRGMHDRVHLRADSAKRAYIANTIGHLSALRQGVDSGSEVFLVLEDDLLPAAPLLRTWCCMCRPRARAGGTLTAPLPCPCAQSSWSWHSHSGIDLYFQHLLLYIEGAGRRGRVLESVLASPGPCQERPCTSRVRCCWAPRRARPRGPSFI